jgi:excisionase family DNA binding protein
MIKQKKRGRPFGSKNSGVRNPPKCIAIMEASGYVTLDTAAQLTGVHMSTIFRLVRDGLLQSDTVGKFRFIHRQHLADYFDAPPIRERIFAYTPKEPVAGS